jgi:FkbM family methyltransferase
MSTFSRYGAQFQIIEQTDPALHSFWHTVYQSWEPDTYEYILPHLDINKTFLDIGAWQGPMSMVAQKYSKQCICFEPDPIAYEYLVKNIELNNFTNIIPVNLAVSNETQLSMGNDVLGGGGTSYLRPQQSVTCNTISFAEILKRFDLNEDNISVIKIDVEGYEYELLQDPLLKEINVPKHISLHSEFFTDKEPYAQVMQSFFGEQVSYNVNGLGSLFVNKRV